MEPFEEFEQPEGGLPLEVVYFCVLGPLEEALAHEPRVQYLAALEQ